jgi:hypothetical protein
MRVRRVCRNIAKLGAGIVGSVLVIVAGFLAWERAATKSAPWVVSSVRDNGRTLVVDFAGYFNYCAHQPSLHVEQSATEIRIRARYHSSHGVQCGLQVAKVFWPALVHLSAPLAGRKIVGDGQASVPVAPLPVSMIRPINTPAMPELIGMDAAAARRALSRARYRGEANLPPADTAGFVIQQWPRPGARLRYVSGQGYGAVARPVPDLTFSQ